jgi:biotin operon repressor
MAKISSLNISKSQKLMLYVLKEEGADITPVALTLDRLTDKTSMNRLTVNKCVQELKEMGLLSVESGKGKASNTYKLNI